MATYGQQGLWQDEQMSALERDIEAITADLKEEDVTDLNWCLSVLYCCVGVASGRRTAELCSVKLNKQHAGRRKLWGNSLGTMHMPASLMAATFCSHHNQGKY